MGFPDPAAATGIDEERLEVFRRVRDAIRDNVLPVLTEGASDVGVRESQE